jgi:hypothetical protein
LFATRDGWSSAVVVSVDIVVPDPTRAVAVCLMQGIADGERSVGLITIVRDHDAWRMVEELDRSMPELTDVDAGTSSTGSSSIGLFAISPREFAVRWESVERVDGPEYGRSATAVSLIRVEDDGQASEIFAIDSDAETGESDDIWERRISAAHTMTSGLYDLEVEVLHRVAVWAAGDEDYTEESTTERYRWDGSAYVVVLTP